MADWLNSSYRYDLVDGWLAEQQLSLRPCWWVTGWIAVIVTTLLMGDWLNSSDRYDFVDGWLADLVDGWVAEAWRERRWDEHVTLQWPLHGQRRNACLVSEWMEATEEDLVQTTPRNRKVVLMGYGTRARIFLERKRELYSLKGKENWSRQSPAAGKCHWWNDKNAVALSGVSSSVPAHAILISRHVVSSVRQYPGHAVR